MSPYNRTTIAPPSTPESVEKNIRALRAPCAPMTAPLNFYQRKLTHDQAKSFRDAPRDVQLSEAQ